MSVEMREQEVRYNVGGGDSEYINKELGIRKIRLFQPTAKQQAIGIVTTMMVDAGIGETKITVFNSKENSGELFLRAPQTRAVVNGEVKFYDDVKLSKEATDFLLSFLSNYVEKESVERVKLR